MGTKILIFLILFFLTSCDNYVSKEELITGKEGYKYWLSCTASSESVLLINYFDKNGKWLVFLEEDGVFKEQELPNDVVRVEKWRLLNDSIIVFGESRIPDPHTIYKLTQDSMVLYYNYRKTISVNIVAPDSLIPKEYRKILPDRY